MKREKTEQEVIGDMIAGTEAEIFAEAMSQGEDENNGDRSLEEMDDDVPGSEDGDEVEADGEEEGEEDNAPADLEAEGEEGEAEEPDERQDRRGVPSSRMREETERRRRIEAERDAAIAKNREIEARLSAIERERQQPKTAEQKPEKPDMFADPEGYEKWVLDQAEKRASDRFETRQREERDTRVNDAMRMAQAGPRSFEFGAAYNALTKLDPQNQDHRATVQRIVNSPDPGQALFDWWDENGGEDFREQIRSQLFGDERPQRGPQGGARGRPQPQNFSQRNDGNQQPIREFRVPRSLNGASGSSSHRATRDPELYNGSEESIFKFATS